MDERWIAFVEQEQNRATEAEAERWLGLEEVENWRVGKRA